MLERALIDHGSPTLANMKVGSLFTSSCADATGFRAEFRRVQAALESRSVSLTILRVQQEQKCAMGGIRDIERKRKTKK